ncbi:MAG: DUF4350 domain-containing protein [Erythrobacter sp.]
MNETGATGRRASPFNRVAVLGMVIIGFIAFISMLYFLSAGDTGGDDNNGGGHAYATGLNGYAGITRLLEAEGYDVDVSREESGMDSYGLLVLTPTAFQDPDELSEILQKRAYIGPTLVIVPKWYAYGVPPLLEGQVEGEIEDGWVTLTGARSPEWLSELDDHYAFEVAVQEEASTNWSGRRASGKLPEAKVAGVTVQAGRELETLVSDGDTRSLAVQLFNMSEYGDTTNTEPVTFIFEPDLINNYGLADKTRAAMAVELVNLAGHTEGEIVTFDVTMNGLGGTVNLLTLAFRPPFLAATLCLIMAMLIIGWRAFKRFGPALANGPKIAFGKSQLVTNGAGLVVRAGRMRLLADPYADLAERRMADALGLTRPDIEGIDNALATRLPEEEPFSQRAARLRNATSSADILRAAKALKELEGKVSK